MKAYRNTRPEIGFLSGNFYTISVFIAWLSPNFALTVVSLTFVWKAFPEKSKI